MRDMVDDRGLLGDLPRSRPGTRSDKRGPRTAPAPPPPETAAAAQPGELAGEALRAAVGAAEAGLKVASRITGEVLRRLPRR
jgi:hypothetical protein